MCNLIDSNVTVSAAKADNELVVYDFSGTVVDVNEKTGYLIVEDQDSDFFEVHPSSVTQEN